MLHHLLMFPAFVVLPSSSWFDLLQVRQGRAYRAVPPLAMLLVCKIISVVLTHPLNVVVVHSNALDGIEGVTRLRVSGAASKQSESDLQRREGVERCVCQFVVSRCIRCIDKH